MNQTGVAIIAGLLGAVAGAIGGYKYATKDGTYADGVIDGENNVFTRAGYPTDRLELESLLIEQGYTDGMITQLANADIWHLQLLVSAHAVGQLYGLSSI